MVERGAFVLPLRYTPRMDKIRQLQPRKPTFHVVAVLADGLRTTICLANSSLGSIGGSASGPARTGAGRAMTATAASVISTDRTRFDLGMVQYRMCRRGKLLFDGVEGS